MKVQVLFFANFRELLGCHKLEIELESGSKVHQLCELLAQKQGSWFSLFSQPDQNLKLAVNQEMAEFNRELIDGDEVAFFPPVTGG